jgi:hypothetical protein
LREVLPYETDLPGIDFTKLCNGRKSYRIIFYLIIGNIKSQLKFTDKNLLCSIR